MATSPDEPERCGVRTDRGCSMADPMLETVDRLNLSVADAESAAAFDTLSGLILQRLVRVRARRIGCNGRGWTFEVMDMDRHRIDKVLATRLRR